MPRVYVTDTHSLVWYLTGSSLLGAAARNAFDATASGKARVIVPVIVFAEIVFIAERRHIKLDIPAIISRVQATPGFVIESFDLDVVLRTTGVTTIPDMHDRLLVCSALRHDAALITRDQRITGASVVQPVW